MYLEQFQAFFSSGSTIASRGNGSSNNGGGGTLKRVAFKDVPEEEEEADDARYCVAVVDNQLSIEHKISVREIFLMLFIS